MIEVPLYQKRCEASSKHQTAKCSRGTRNAGTPRWVPSEEGRGQGHPTAGTPRCTVSAKAFRAPCTSVVPLPSITLSARTTRWVSRLSLLLRCSRLYGVASSGFGVQGSGFRVQGADHDSVPARGEEGQAAHPPATQGPS
jgi:hypothetical protein